MTEVRTGAAELVPKRRARFLGWGNEDSFGRGWDLGRLRKDGKDVCK